MKKSLVMGILLALGLLAASQTEASAFPLSPPFDVAAIRATVGRPDKAGFACTQPPTPLRDLHFESMYKKGDESASAIDEEAYGTYKKSYAPAAVYEKKLAEMANRYVRSNPARDDIAACAFDWLYAWAKAGALMGDVNRNGEYIRKWLLASVANDWLQIRDAPSLDANRKKIVLDWIGTVAHAAMEDFSRDSRLKSRRNNHLYWAAWGVAAGAIAVDDRAMFDWAMDRARFGIGEIQADGTLPLELSRKGRAYLYHLFAAMPLFALAEAGYKNKIDLFAENDRALDRLARVNLDNVGRPDYFARLTGETQDTAHTGSASDLGWAEIYSLHSPGEDAAKSVLEKFRPMKASRMGGDMTLLYAGKN